MRGLIWLLTFFLLKGIKNVTYIIHIYHIVIHHPFVILVYTLSKTIILNLSQNNSFITNPVLYSNFFFLIFLWLLIIVFLYFHELLNIPRFFWYFDMAAVGRVFYTFDICGWSCCFPNVRMVLRGWARQNGQQLSLLVDTKAKIEEHQLFSQYLKT